jgi:hypothetical protein
MRFLSLVDLGAMFGDTRNLRNWHNVIVLIFHFARFAGNNIGVSSSDVVVP